MPLSDLYGHRFRWPEIELFRQFLLWSIKSFKNSHWWDPGMQPAHYKDYIVWLISPLVLYVLGSTHIICHEPKRNNCKQESKKIYPCTLKHDLKPCYLTAKALVGIGRHAMQLSQMGAAPCEHFLWQEERTPKCDWHVRREGSHPKDRVWKWSVVLELSLDTQTGI